VRTTSSSSTWKRGFLLYSVIYYKGQLTTDFVFKSIASGLLYVFLWLFGDINDAVIALLALMTLDTLLGLLAAVKHHDVSSDKLRQGAVKLLLYFILIIAANCVDRVVALVPLISQAIQIRSFTMIYLAVSEGISVLENLSSLGVAVPKVLLKRLRRFKQSMER